MSASEQMLEDVARYGYAYAIKTEDGLERLDPENVLCLQDSPYMDDRSTITGYMLADTRTDIAVSDVVHIAKDLRRK